MLGLVKYTKWYCDECGAFLNKQKGFDEELGQWECRKCGYVNSLDSSEILSKSEYKKFKKSGYSSYNDYIKYDNLSDNNSVDLDKIASNISKGIVDFVNDITTSLDNDDTDDNYEDESNYDEDSDDEYDEDYDENYEDEDSAEDYDENNEDEDYDGYYDNIENEDSNDDENEKASTEDDNNKEYELVTVGQKNIDKGLTKDYYIPRNEYISNYRNNQKENVKKYNYYDDGDSFRESIKKYFVIGGLVVGSILVIWLLFYTIFYFSTPRAKKDEIMLPLGYKEYKDKNYTDVKREFENMGFESIECVGMKDLVTGWVKKKNTVDRVSINGNTKFSKGDIYKKNSKIVIYYHSFKK